MGTLLDAINNYDKKRHRPQSSGSLLSAIDNYEPNIPTAQSFFDLGVRTAPGLGFGEPLEKSEFATDLNLTRSQMAAERRAERELYSLERDFYRVGEQEGFEEYAAAKGHTDAPGMLDTAMETVFDSVIDRINAVDYAATGAIQEMLRTGSSWAGFKRAALEFESGMRSGQLPGATRPSHVDILEDQGVSKWGAWTGGLIMDMVLSPLNLIPGGAIANVVGKGARATRRFAEATPGAEAVVRAGEFLFTPDRHIKRLGEAGDIFLQSRKVAEDAITDETVQFVNNVDSMLAWMRPHERRLLGTWMDQPIRLKQELVAISKAMPDLLPATRIPKIMDQAKDIQKLTDDMFVREMNAGIVDDGMQRDFYVHGTRPVDPALQRAYHKIHRERRPTTTIPIGQRMPATMARKTANQAERLEKALAGNLDYATELDIRNILIKRGTDSIRWVNYRSFLDAVATDGRIVSKIVDDVDLLNNPKAWKAFKKDIAESNPGYKVLEVTKKVREASGRQAEDIIGGYVMPSRIVDSMTKMDFATRDTSDMGRFFETLDSLTSIWRGWATLGTGYHLRNYTSILFMNWMAGVGNSFSPRQMQKLKRYPVPGDFILRHLQGLRLQIAADGAGSLPPRMRKAADNLSKVLGFKGIADITMPTIKAGDGSMLSIEDIVKLGQSYSVPQNVSKLYNYSDDAVSSVWKGVDGSVTLDGLEATGAHKLTAQALTLGADTRPAPREWLSKIFGNDNPLLQLNRAVAQQVENNGRWTLFLDRLVKGAPVEEAALAPKTWHFDYRNLTEIEKKVFRTLIPFYAWQRFAVPRMVSSMMENPARFARIGKVSNAIERLSDDWSNIPQPDYFDEVAAIQLPIAHQDKPLFAQLDVPVLELNRMNKKDVLSSLHPMAKLVIEDAPSGGHSLFLGMPLERFPGEELEGVGMTKKTAHTLSSFFPPAGKIIRAKVAADKGKLPEQIISELTGVKLRAVDTRRVLRARKFERRKLAKEYKKILQQKGVMRPSQ